ncbi:MAG: hypothetical protein EOO65_02350, partial [Methanosarcinales archaeon]
MTSAASTSHHARCIAVNALCAVSCILLFAFLIAHATATKLCRTIDAAFETVRAVYKEATRFESLVTLLRDAVDDSPAAAEIWEFKHHAIMFINQFLNCFDLEERIELRMELRLAGLDEALNELDEMVQGAMGTEGGVVGRAPPLWADSLQALSSGMDAFVTIMSRDELEAKDSSHGLAAGDAAELFNEVLQAATSQGQTAALLQMLKYLLAIPAMTFIGRNLWQRAESCLRIIVCGTEAERGALKYDDIGVIMEQQTQMAALQHKIEELQKQLQVALRTTVVQRRVMPPMMPLMVQPKTEAEAAVAAAQAARHAERESSAQQQLYDAQQQISELTLNLSSMQTEVEELRARVAEAANVRESCMSSMSVTEGAMNEASARADAAEMRAAALQEEVDRLSASLERALAGVTPDQASGQSGQHAGSPVPVHAEMSASAGPTPGPGRPPRPGMPGPSGASAGGPP